jgi:Fur family ferric uptake transcriptional regulator
MQTSTPLQCTLHSEERKQFERLLRLQGIDRMADCMAVIEAFLSEEGHFTAAQWHERLEAQGVSLAGDFVEKTLDLMATLGFCDRGEFEGSPPRYEHRHLGEHHDHLICTRCGSITEFERPELESLKLEVTRDHGFHHLRHKLQIYGICSKCISTRKPAAPLSMAAAGERVRIERMPKGQKVSRHLNSMGLTVGTELEVISNSGGMMMVNAAGTRLAIGQEISSRIFISLIS